MLSSRPFFIVEFIMFFCSNAFSQINLQTDQFIACFEKHSDPNEHRFFVLNKSKKTLDFSSSCREETIQGISIHAIEKKIIIHYGNNGINPKLTIDLANLNATWIVINQPSNIETYSTCKGFKRQSEVITWIQSQFNKH